MKFILIIILSLCFISCGNHEKEESNFKKSKVIARIYYTSSGCFGGKTSSLTIIDSVGKRKAVMTSSNDGQSLTTSNNMRSVVLDYDKMQAFNRFILELTTRKFSSGCTTEDHYSVKIGSRNIEKTDGSCSWNGFYNLRRSLFNWNLIWISRNGWSNKCVSDSVLTTIDSLLTWTP